MSRKEILLEFPTRLQLINRGRYLEYFTIVYNSLEGLIAVVAGLIAGSIALLGFGFDSRCRLFRKTRYNRRAMASIQYSRV